MTREHLSVDTYEAARRRLMGLRDADLSDRVETFADLFRQIKMAGDDLRTIAQIHGRYNDYEGSWAVSGVVHNVAYHFFTNRAISYVGIKGDPKYVEGARFHVPHGIARYKPDYYLEHSDNLPGFEAAKFQDEPQPPPPGGNPVEYFIPHIEPDSRIVQQGFVEIMQDCLGVVLEGTRQNDRRFSLRPGVFDSAQGVDLGDDFTLYRVPFDRRTPKLGQGLVKLGPYELK